MMFTVTYSISDRNRRDWSLAGDCQDDRRVSFPSVLRSAVKRSIHWLISPWLDSAMLYVFHSLRISPLDFESYHSWSAG